MSGAMGGVGSGRKSKALHANGDDSEPAYRKAILDRLLVNGGRPRGLRRSITDPLGVPSLR